MSFQKALEDALPNPPWYSQLQGKALEAHKHVETITSIIADFKAATYDVMEAAALKAWGVSSEDFAEYVTLGENMGLFITYEENGVLHIAATDSSRAVKMVERFANQFVNQITNGDEKEGGK